MNILIRTLFLVVLLVGLWANQAVAVPITVPNFSFESPDVPDNSYTFIVPDWTLDPGTLGVEDPYNRYPGDVGDNSALPGPADGGQTGMINLGSSPIPVSKGFMTTLPVATTQMNTLYTLTVAVGNDSDVFDNFNSVLSIFLLVNDLPVASSAITPVEPILPNGEFADLSTSFLGTVSGLPLDIAIRYAGLSGLVSFDNVRLDATVASSPVPEPATMLLLCSGLVGLAGFRKKFKK